MDYRRYILGPNHPKSAKALSDLAIMDARTRELVIDQWTTKAQVVPASPAARLSNPSEASEADFQLLQRVDSGKDLRASICGRLSGHGQGRAERGEQPDLQ